MKLQARIRIKDHVSGLSHLAGALLGVAGLIYLLTHARAQADLLELAAYSVFGISLFLLYGASALYHLTIVGPETERVFRLLDHSMIFVLIAGSYTPYCLISLRPTIGWLLFSVVWGLAIVGVPIRIFWRGAPRWISTSLYLLMGWVVVLAIGPMSRALSTTAMTWLVVGGVFYTVGSVIYAIKKPDPFPPLFGFHEIWHLFVLAGSASHFLSIKALL